MGIRNRKRVIESVHECISSFVLSSWRGRLLGWGFALRLIPRPRPRAESASTAALAAPSDDRLVRPRDLLRAPNACALITANVPEMGGVGEGERDVREDEAVAGSPARRGGRPSWPSLPSLLRSSEVLSAREYGVGTRLGLGIELVRLAPRR
jgi:hypothetical protein